MKFLKHLSVLIAVASILLISCEPDDNPCPDAIITVSLDSGTQTYTITAEGLEDIVYGWYVDDNLVETEDLDDLRDDIFGFELEPGTYNICVRAESDICDGSIEICAEVTIEASCLELEFESEEEDDFTYVFTADFEGIEDTEYTWYVNGDSVETESIDTNRSHVFDYQFAEEGLYEVCIKATTDCGDIEYCEEIEVGRDPEDCPDLFFASDLNAAGGYTFTAEFGGMDTITYYWYINEEVVDKENFDGLETDHELEWFFEPGEYVICIVAEVDGCEEEFCEEIFIESDCVEEVSFNSESEDGYFYVFTATFEGLEDTRYKWYINEEVVDYENFEDHETDHLMRWTFTPGEYVVCLTTYEEDCEEVEICETIIVEEDCPELSFIATADGEYSYLFEADFVGKEETSYKWTINDEVVDKENYDGVDTDHQLYWQFNPGEYVVCILVETDRCESVEYCQTIIIEGESESCPDLAFTYEQATTGEFIFQADFPGIDTLEWYGWYVDGELVENEGTTNAGDNILQTDLEVGTHEVCIMTETPDCPSGTEYCKTITVDPAGGSCAQMSYTAERDETAPAYTFTADFAERDEVSYEWHVYVNDDYQGGEVRDAGSTDDHSFYWQFESGVVYEICLRAVDESCIDFQECKEFVID